MIGNYTASLIVSVYKGASQLRCLLDALSYQSRSDFEIIISEDGCAPEMRDIVLSQSRINQSRIKHLTQDDRGFRKNKALNRAVHASNTERLIFIDGDCIPSVHFVQEHIGALDISPLCTGRRVELGAIVSNRLLTHPRWIESLSLPAGLSRAAPSLLFDKTKNIESGIYSRLLQRLHPKQSIDLLGCNFSCSKDLLMELNGFDERYESPGLGEDSDIQVRADKLGIKPRNLKFLATLFHLHHDRQYTVSSENQEKFKQAVEGGQHRCLNGLDQYLYDCRESVEPLKEARRTA